MGPPCGGGGRAGEVSAEWLQSLSPKASEPHRGEGPSARRWAPAGVRTGRALLCCKGYLRPQSNFDL